MSSRIFRKDWTSAGNRASLIFRDPAPPAFAPVRGFGGGGARRHSNRAKDFDNVTQKAYEKAVESLCRLGAKVEATNATASHLLRWYLSIDGYDLDKARGGLIGLSNSLTVNPNDWDRAIHAKFNSGGTEAPARL